MKKNNGMVGFWAAISIAGMFLGCVLSVAYLNPSNSLSGLLAVLATLLVWLLIANHVLNILYKEENSEKENIPNVTASPEAMSVKDGLNSEFSRLVSKIAWHNAGNDDKLRIQMIKEGETEGKVLISPEDMEKAFLEAAKLVTEKCALDNCSCKTNCDKQTVLQRIQNIRKNFETP